MIIKFLNNGIDGVLNTCKLSSHVSSIEVVIDSFEPSDIIMGVGDEMNGEVGSIDWIFLVMMFFHHFLVCKSEVGECSGD